jgi:hypothetical protein
MPRQRFKLGIVILAHRSPQQLAALLSALAHPQVTTYLHVDRRADGQIFRAALEHAGVGDVVWLKRRRTSWGSIKIVDAELEGISRASADGCSYILVISGEDFPLRPIGEIVEFTEANQDRSYVQAVPVGETVWALGERSRTDFYSYKLRDRIYTCIPRGEDTSHMNRKGQVLNWALRAYSSFKPERRFPEYLAPYGGGQWLNLSAQAAEYVLEFLQTRADYRPYHQHTACADEILIQSILFGSGFAADHGIVNDDLRFQIWGDGDHPRKLKHEDLPAMLASADLFARKVSAEQHPELWTKLLELSAFAPAVANLGA